MYNLHTNEIYLNYHKTKINITVSGSNYDIVRSSWKTYEQAPTLQVTKFPNDKNIRYAYLKVHSRQNSDVQKHHMKWKRLPYYSYDYDNHIVASKINIKKILPCKKN